MAKGRKTGGRDFIKGDPRAGRREGAKDKRPRIGRIRAVYQDFIETRDGHDKMVTALDEGIQNPKRALGYMELGARVLVHREEARAFYRETRRCPLCGKRGVFHDPERGEEPA